MKLRRRLGVTGKLWVSMIILVIIVMLPVSMALERGIRSLYFRYTADELLHLGSGFAELISRASSPEANDAVRTIANISGTSMLVIDTNGTVTTSSSALAGEVGETLSNPRILQALSGRAEVFVTRNQALSGSIFVASVPIIQTTDQPHVAGAVVLFRSTDSVEKTMITVRRVILAASVLLLTLLSGLAWFLSRMLARPLLEMKDATREIAAGNYDVRVQSTGGDELDDLALAINDLGTSLRDHEQGRRSFFANVSHELRTPLSYLQGYADALAEGMATTPEDVQRYGRILAEESRRLTCLVDDLFILARAEEGQLTLEPTEIDVSKSVEAGIERVAGKAAERAIQIDRTQLSPCRAFADRNRVEQVLINLLDNAIRHTPQGGRIAISTQTSGLFCQVRVEDSGPGFAPIARESFVTATDSKDQSDGSHLTFNANVYFERFFRGDKSRNRHYGGTGMGLAIVKALVEASGGQVSAGQSSDLGGACVTFSLPRQAPLGDA